MKYIFFFGLIGLFIWTAVVPPSGYSKYPAVTVQVQYNEESNSAQISVKNHKTKTEDEEEDK